MTEGIHKVAVALYDNLKDYRIAREAQVEKEKGLKRVLEEIKEEMKQTPATVTLTGVDVHASVITEKAQVLADLGILREVFGIIEDLDEHFETSYINTLDSLTEGMI